MYIEHRSDRVTTQCAAFHGASANPASLHTTFPRFQLGSVVPLNSHISGKKSRNTKEKFDISRIIQIYTIGPDRVRLWDQ
jgi:hypothetical protein